MKSDYLDSWCIPWLVFVCLSQQDTPFLQSCRTPELNIAREALLRKTAHLDRNFALSTEDTLVCPSKNQRFSRVKPKQTNLGFTGKSYSFPM